MGIPITLTRGIHLSAEDMSPEAIAASWDQISDREGEIVPENGAAQAMTALAG